MTPDELYREYWRIQYFLMQQQQGAEGESTTVYEAGESFADEMAANVFELIQGKWTYVGKDK